MAGTITLNGVGKWGLDVIGHYHVVPWQYTGPASYTTGGEAIGGQQLKLGAVEFMLGGYAIATSGAATAVIFMWNQTTGKLQAFWGNAGTAGTLPEVTSTTDLSGYVGILIAFGRA